MIRWRRESVTVRLKRPTRLDRARSVGYKPIKGLFIVRQALKRGPHKRPTPGGRRSKTKTSRLNLKENYQFIAEKRANRKFPNMEVLGSYWVGQDGHVVWYEVVLADPSSPDVAKRFPVLARGRAQRGLTSAGRKVRGLRKKGPKAIKSRPSRKA